MDTFAVLYYIYQRNEENKQQGAVVINSMKSKKIVSIVSVVIMLGLWAAVFFFIGKPFVENLRNPEQFRLWVDSKGVVGKLIFVGMTALQVIVSIIPGEPFEIAAGYAFGFWEGTLLSEIGILIGSALVFVFVKHVGIKAVEAFFPPEKIESLKFLQDTDKLRVTVFILFFIPGTPKDILTYFVGLTKMKLAEWLVITGVARLPSLITSTLAGSAVGNENYKIAIMVFALTAVVSIAGMVIYKKYLDKKNAKTDA